MLWGCSVGVGVRFERCMPFRLSACCGAAVWGCLGEVQAFSPDDRYLLTVSRDRAICLYQHSSMPSPGFKTPLPPPLTHTSQERQALFPNRGEIPSPFSNHRHSRKWIQRDFPPQALRELVQL